jgi:acid phosphatase
MAIAIRPRLNRRFLVHPSALLCALLLALAGCAGDGGTTSTPGGAAQPLPRFDHIVVVVEENHAYGDIVGSADAPYINSLRQRGAEFTDSHAVAHPSEPNYLALFAGSTFGLSSDDCPQSFNALNLGGELLAHNLSFVGYSESLPQPGFTGCDDGNSHYARKHNPWVNFADVPATG